MESHCTDILDFGFVRSKILPRNFHSFQEKDDAVAKHKRDQGEIWSKKLRDEKNDTQAEISC